MEGEGLRKFALVAVAAVSANAAIGQSLGGKPGEVLGAWEVETVADKFTDARMGIAHTKLGKESMAAIKCDKPGPGSLYLMIEAPQFLGSDRVERPRAHMAGYRLDEGPIVDLPSPYYDGKIALIFSGRAGPVLREMAAQTPKRLRVRFVNYEGNFVTVDLDVSGMSNAIYRTAQICEDTNFVQ